MKNKFMPLIVFLIIINLTLPGLCSPRFSPGIKLGINFNKYEFIEQYLAATYHSPTYSYPPGLILGISNEINLSRALYIANEIYFKNTKSIISIYTIEEISKYTFKGSYLRFSAILGIKIFKISDLLIGLDFGKLIRADVNLTHQLNYPSFYENITDNSPAIDAAICLGIAKKFDLKKLRLILEIKYLISPAKYRYWAEYGYWEIGEWRTHGPHCVVGLQF
jgi:hypothetical protein